MGRTPIRVSVARQRIVNQAVLFAVRVPASVKAEPGAYIRGFRSALRMTQSQLARRCGLARPHITRLEAGKSDARVATLRRIFDALFCDLLILPLPRGRRPGDALAERKLGRIDERGIWD